MGFLKVYAKKEKRTAAKTKAARLLTYVERPNDEILCRLIAVSAVVHAADLMSLRAHNVQNNALCVVTNSKPTVFVNGKQLNSKATYVCAKMAFRVQIVQTCDKNTSNEQSSSNVDKTVALKA